MLSIMKFVLLLAVFAMVTTADDITEDAEREVKDNLSFEDLRSLDPVNGDDDDDSSDEEDAKKLFSILTSRNKIDDLTSDKYEKRGWGRRTWRRFTGRVRKFFRKVKTVYRNAKTVFGKK